MGRKDNRCPLVAQGQNLLFQEVGIDRVESREGLIEDQQLGLVQHRDDKLHLLGHTLRELLDLLVPPRLDAELLEPHLQPLQCIAARKTLEAGKEEGLFAHLHLLIKAALLGQVADAIDIFGLQLPIAEQYATLIGGGDTVDDADQGRLSGTVGAEQSIDRSARNRQRHIVESRMAGIMFRDVFYSKQTHDFFVLVTNQRQI